MLVGETECEVYGNSVLSPQLLYKSKTSKKNCLEKLEKKVSQKSIFKTVILSHMWGCYGVLVFRYLGHTQVSIITQCNSSAPSKVGPTGLPACQYGFCFDKTFKFCSGQLPGE